MARGDAGRPSPRCVRPTPVIPLPQTKGRPKALNALGTLARHPELTEAFNTFNGYILFVVDAHAAPA